MSTMSLDFHVYDVAGHDSYMDHSHHNSKAPKFDSDYVMVLNDANLGFVITGNPPSRYP